jgi:hypothetical protein
MVMVRPQGIRRRQVGFHRLFLPGGMAHDFTAVADALIGLDMRAGGYFLQEYLYRLAAGFAFKGQDAGGFAAHLFPQYKLV